MPGLDIEPVGVHIYSEVQSNGTVDPPVKGYSDKGKVSLLRISYNSELPLIWTPEMRPPNILRVDTVVVPNGTVPTRQQS